MNHGDTYHRVFEFHERFRCTIHHGLRREEDIALRVELIREEFQELTDALQSWLAGNHTPGTFMDICDALADLDYVVAGAAVAFGVPLPELAREVHASNMSKLDENGEPIYREDGKVLKGSDFRSPRIQAVLHEVGILDEWGQFMEGWDNA